jgi:long-chain acyl-CoA synthetase
MYLTAGLHRTLQRNSDLTATVFGPRRQSYSALVDRVSRSASALQALGLQPGERLALLAQNSDRLIELLLAAWWCGLVACPLNTRWSPQEIAYALQDCEAGALAVDDACLGSVQVPTLPSLRARLYIGERAKGPEGWSPWEPLVATALPVPDVRCDPQTLAVIVYTGGTTGPAKGVMLSHANIWASMMGRLAVVPNPEQSVTLLISPLFHIAGLGRMVVQIMTGGTCVCLSGFAPYRVVELMAQEGANDFMAVPSMLHILLETPGFDPGHLPNLERILWGAAPMPPALLRRVLARFPNAEFIHAYGMTETAASVALLRVEHSAAFLQSDRIRSAGRPTVAVEIQITDEQGVEVPPGTPGEIRLKGPAVMQGYWGRPQQTREAFHNGWLCTGDAGIMDSQGYLYITDRIKDMIISGGENIYSTEVENALAQHPAVSASAVVGIPHPKWGEAVHAVVVFKPGHTATPEDLGTHCRHLIAGFKCPKSYEFRERLPLTAAGKVAKNLLCQSVAPM